MSSPSSEHDPGRRETDRKINSRTGGALLIWIGAALLSGTGWGIGLVGVGVILLVEQLARRHLALKYERFWVIVGAAALFFGIGIAVGLKDAFVPILLVVIGGILVAKTFMDRGES